MTSPGRIRVRVDDGCATRAMGIGARQLLRELAGKPEIHDDVRLDLIAPLRDLILAKRASGKESQGSLNVGGWKSGAVFSGTGRADYEAFSDLESAIRGKSGVDVAHLAGWAMINEKGSYHQLHQHGTKIVSGVYYVTAGDPAVATEFHLETSGPTWHPEDEIVSIEPKPGRLVLFPSTMWHRVPVYPGTEPRITVAFDFG